MTDAIGERVAAVVTDAEGDDDETCDGGIEKTDVPDSVSTVELLEKYDGVDPLDALEVAVEPPENDCTLVAEELLVSVEDFVVRAVPEEDAHAVGDIVEEAAPVVVEEDECEDKRVNEVLALLQLEEDFVDDADSEADSEPWSDPEDVVVGTRDSDESADGDDNGVLEPPKTVEDCVEDGVKAGE